MHTAVHYARQGARITDARWSEIEALAPSIEYEQSAWTLLYTELRKEHIPRNSGKPPYYYIDVINERIIPKLAEHGPDQYKNCAMLQKFAERLKEDIQRHEASRRSEL